MTNTLLTPTQTDVLRLLSLGFTQAEVALNRHCSINAVKAHVKDIQARLGARNMAHAVSIAFEKGILH